ncbi:MAG: hypothetical protein IPK10_18275 [Bacteroidetes bacterium]|nr:hypothetical protein [Bacteroidota bacterium]
MTKKTVVRADLSSSYTSEKTWWNETQNYIHVKVYSEARFRKTKVSCWSHDHFVQTQLGYTSFIDSSWIKSSDAFKIHLRWMEKRSKRITHTYFFQLQSQWMNTWQQTSEQKTWKGGFMNPAAISMGYSFAFDFLENSNLLLAPATFQINIQPEQSTSIAFKERPLLKAKHSHIYSRYGFSAYLTIDEYFYKDFILLQHRSQLFFNAITAQQIQFDINNRLCFRFFKYVQLRFDTSVTYLPEQTLKLQYKQEVLLGIFYEYRK